MISATGQLLLTLRGAASVSPPSAEEGAVVWCFATNSLDANSPPRPREAGSPCVFVVIYRVSPAKLSDCICLRGALLVHTSHPLDSSFSKHTGRREMLVLLRSAAVCVACVCVVAVQWLWGENVKLQGEVFGIWARFLCWMVCGPIMKKSLTSFWIVSHYFFTFFEGFLFLTCESLWDVGSRARPEQSVSLSSSRTFQQVRQCALHLSALFFPALPPALISSSTLDPSLAQWDIRQLFSTPQLFSQLSGVAARHQFVDKSPFLNSTSRSISPALNALRNDWWSGLLGGLRHYL